jgi:hypothetical protein
LYCSNAGDVNGDGLDDLIVGAYKADSKAGKCYVIFGKKDSVTIDLSAIVQAIAVDIACGGD